MGAGGHRTARSSVCVVTIHLAAWVCMSIGGPQPLDKPTSSASGHWSSAMSRPWSPSISLVDAPDDLFQRPSACLFGDDTRLRVRPHRRSAAGHRAAHPSRKSVDLCRVSRADHERDAIHSCGCQALRDADCCSTSTTCSYRRPITASPRSTISPIFRSPKSAKSISPVMPSNGR